MPSLVRLNDECNSVQGSTTSIARAATLQTIKQFFTRRIVRSTIRLNAASFRWISGWPAGITVLSPYDRDSN